MAADSGTMRSVASLPSGTFNQVPVGPSSTMLPSSRSSSSPTRSPAPRSTVNPTQGKRIIQAGNGVRHRRIDVRAQRTRQRLVEFGDVGGEDQPPRWCLLPAPGGDVVRVRRLSTADCATATETARPRQRRRVARASRECGSRPWRP